jgi:protein ImuB
MAVDSAAGRVGLKVGMTVAQAQAFVPELTIVEADSCGDAAGLGTLAAWAVRRYSPIAAPDPPDGITVDSTGCEHLFGGEEAMLADMLERLNRNGITVRIGMADTPGAAYAVARFSADPIRIVRPGGTEDALRLLPVAALRLPSEISIALCDMGLKCIGQVAGTPRPSLSVRFGEVVGQRLDWASGATTELIPRYLPQGMPRRRLVFAEPLARMSSFGRAAKDLAHQLADDLERRGMGACALDLLFERVDNTIQTIRTRLAQPSRDPHHFTRLFRERLDTIDPGFGIDAISLAASHVEALSPHQTVSTLGGTNTGRDLSEFVDRLANLPRVRQVVRLAPVESDLPERSVRRLPALSLLDPATWPACPRPTRLIDPPEPIVATPTDAPAEFTWRGRSHRICKIDGPERVHGEWWRDPHEVVVTRDYYRVEDETGTQFWIVHSDGSWCLQGLFG